MAGVPPVWAAQAGRSRPSVARASVVAAYEGDVNAHQRRIKRRRIARAELDATPSMWPLFASMLRAAEWDSWAFVYAP